LGYQYAFSKRTNLYAVYSDISNNGDHKYNPAVVGDSSNAGDTYQNAFQFGLRHQF
jgi:predicted porin